MSKVYEAYIPVNVIEKIYCHFKKEALCKKEAIGLLLGKPSEYRGEKYVRITNYITGENSASSMRASFEKSAFTNLAAQYLQSRAIIVGWAHSHPSFGCFLSSTDVQTQSDLFTEDFNVAMVVDPNKLENGFLQTRFYKLTSVNSYREISFAVTRED